MRATLTCFIMLLLYFSNGQDFDNKHRAKAKIGAGSTLLALGGVGVGCAIAYDNIAPVGKDSPRNDKAFIGVGYGLGGAFMVGGAILLGLGLHEKGIYLDRKASVSLMVTDRLGITYTF